MGVLGVWEVECCREVGVHFLIIKSDREFEIFILRGYHLDFW